LAKERKAPWIVADGYQFGFEYHRLIKDTGQRLLVIDDYGHDSRYCADLVLNQNIHAAPDLYEDKEPNTTLLLGTRYALIRREFLAWQTYLREIPPKAYRILISLGGGDPENVTQKVLRALNQVYLKPLEATVIVGGANPHVKELSIEIKKIQHSVLLLKDVSNMPELMARADVAITAGGSTCWETAFMGLPALMIILADNQRPSTEKLAALGIAVNLGWHANASAAKIARDLTRLIKDPILRAELSQTGRKLVDGYGAARVLMHLKNLRIRLRPVSPGDASLLWDWTNDPVVRQSSFSQDHIPWEKHLAWFQQKLHDPNCHFFIALDHNDRPVGQVRFEISDNEAEIHLSITKGTRGLKLSSILIDMATEKIYRVTNVSQINAFIKPNNVASIKAFSKAKYNFYNNKELKHCQKALHYVRFKNYI
jgi:UDP-2,4-diacetamido-2,4,6-trideoxy-beta-L-altropyranose hydrolase